MSPGRMAAIALVLAVIGGGWALVALTGENHGTPDALLLDEARQEDPVAWQDSAEDDDASGGPDPTAGSQGTSGGDTSDPAPAGGGRGDSSGGADT